MIKVVHWLSNSGYWLSSIFGASLVNSHDYMSLQYRATLSHTHLNGQYNPVETLVAFINTSDMSGSVFMGGRGMDVCP